MIHVEEFKIKSLDELNEIRDKCKPLINTLALILPESTSPIKGGFDIPVMSGMFSALRNHYSLDTVNADDFKQYAELSELVSDIFGCVTEKGVIKFLRKYSKSFNKYMLLSSILRWRPVICSDPLEPLLYRKQCIEAMCEQYSKNCYDLCYEILRP